MSPFMKNGLMSFSCVKPMSHVAKMAYFTHDLVTAGGCEKFLQALDKIGQNAAKIR